MQIHQEVSVLPEARTRKGLCENVCTLFQGWNVLDDNRTRRNQFANKMKSYVDMLSPS